jgi:hypothetical protein
MGQTASSGGRPGDDSQDGPSPTAVGLPQHADQHRSERPVLLAVDQNFGLHRWLAVRRWPHQQCPC